MARSPSALPVTLCVLTGAMLTAPWAAGRYREFQLARAVPWLDPEMRRHIAADSDRGWYAYCRKAGTETISAALRDLRAGLHASDFSRFERNRGPVEAAYLRVGGAVREIHGIDALERRIRRDIALAPRVDFERHQWERRFVELASDTVLAPAARIRELDGITLRFLAAGDTTRAVFSSVTAAQCEPSRDLYGSRLRATIAIARTIREDYMICQLLGDLGGLLGSAGKADSMRACYDEAIALARRHRLFDQAARLLRFYADYYVDHGRLAAALDRQTEAVRIAEGPGGEATQPRQQIEYTKFLAALGCWDLVDRSLQRVPPLLRRMPERSRTPYGVRYEFDADLLQARLDFVSGRVDEANLRMQSLSQAVPPGDRRAGLAELFDQWSLGLERAGRTQETLEVCARGLAHCDSAHVPERVPRLLLRCARLEISLGRLGAAQALLDSARARAPLSGESGSRLRLEAEVLQARLLFLEGRRTLARRRIERLYRQFRDQGPDTEGASPGDPEAADAEALRDAIHEIEQFTPEQSYRFEMEWRSLTRRQSLPRLAGGPGDLGWSSAQPKAPRPAGTHLVYRFTGNALVRWVANARGVEMDTISLSAERCLIEARRALECLQTEQAAPEKLLGPESLARLRSLSELLLPPSLPVSQDRPPRLDITPDGPLCALPFEALPFPPSGEAPPLAMTADVAYLRGWDDSHANATGRVVILSNPDVPDEFPLRYGWVGKLSESDAEAREALQRWPRAVVLTGAEATKDSIRARWPGASIIYLAAHHVRDPDAPILGFVPLSAPPGSPPDASMLESADVRALDLSACRLAVLASCSSGTPYRTAVRPGPSFGDAFLDAGVAAVVGSFWDVGDVETREFMRVLLADWRPDRPDAVSLGKARREVMRRPQGASPRVWAAWAVETASAP